MIYPPTGFSAHDRGDTTSDAHSDPGPLSPTPGRPRSGSNASRLRESLSLSHRRNRSSSNHSTHVPADLPIIPDSAVDKEEQWEKRATILVGAPVVPVRPALPAEDPQADENIQEAIRLHEAGELEKSTAMFGRLADADNPLSQVLYGLALRHGWGCTMDKEKGLEYLRKAASNSAAVEQEALKAGMKKGGSAKGELVLAIYEVSPPPDTRYCLRANADLDSWAIPTATAGVCTRTPWPPENTTRRPQTWATRTRRTKSRGATSRVSAARRTASSRRNSTAWPKSRGTRR